MENIKWTVMKWSWGLGERKDKYKEKEKVIFYDTKPRTIRIKGKNIMKL